MIAVLTTILPVFVLIAIGYGAGRSGYVSEAGAKGLPEFVFRIAMPVMLFRTIGSAKLPDIAPTAIVVSFFGSVLITWGIAAALTRWPIKRNQSDGASIAMGSTFANSVMLGIPIGIGHFGQDAAPILALIILFDSALLWLFGTLHFAASEGTGDKNLVALLGNLLWRLLTNPIILGCAAGLAWQLTGLHLPSVADVVVTMLANAAIPGALVALGLALNSYSFKGEGLAVVTITFLKLLVMPLIAYVLAFHIFQLPRLAASLIVVIAAMPVGGNAYLFAVAYNRQVPAVSGAIALSTPLALITLPLLLYWLG
jgi:malonate transporter and related proteins